MLSGAITGSGSSGPPPGLQLSAPLEEPTSPRHVLWSSLWPDRPDDTIRFEIRADGGSGSLLEWELLADGPEPTAHVLGHLRHRLNELINRDLRESFGQ